MKGKILYVYNLHVSFILKDISFLQSSFSVDKYFFSTAGSVRLIKGFFDQILTLPRKVRNTDLVIVFFAGYHSLIPVLLAKMMNKPCLVMLGGADCYNFPSIDYGNYRKTLIRLFTSLSIRHASHVSPVHEALIESEYTYDDQDSPRQGYKAFIKNLQVPETTIYLEYDPQLFSFRSKLPAPKSFITVGFGMDGNTYRRKGVDLLVEAAKAYPDCTFTVVGSNNPESHSGLPANIQLLRPVPYDQLPALYQSHQYYLQLSMAEGFPSAICEAMLCGCVPIGSNVAAIPYIIGDSGFVLEKKNVQRFIELCGSALHADVNRLGLNARQRIEKICAPGSRSSRLIALAEALIR